jgi:hypothetical protein
MAAPRGGVYLGCMSPRILAPLLVGTVLAAGCGQATAKSPTTPPATTTPTTELIADSAVATRRAGSAHVAFKMNVSAAGQAGALVMNGRGEVALGGHRAELVFHMASPQAGMSIDMTERLIGTDLYMRSPLLTSGVGTPWVRLDLQRLGARAGIDLNALMSMRNSDPTEMLSYLQASSRSLELVGEDTIRGVKAAHYHVVVDLQKIADSAPAAERRAFRRIMAEELRVLGTHTLPVDVWIDSSGLVRRERVDMTLRSPSLPQDVSMQMTMDLFDFGAPVHVVAPPAGQVTDVTDTLP